MCVYGNAVRYLILENYVGVTEAATQRRSVKKLI